MTQFPQAIAANLAGSTVRSAALVLFDFEGEPVRVWSGIGTLNSGGNDWEGLGELGQITNLEQAINGQAPEASFVLSPIDADILRLARDEFDAKGRGRKVTVYAQFFNEDDDKPLTAFDEPYAIWSGRMQTPKFSIQPNGQRRVEVTAESLFALRSRPRFGNYTDRDQQKRFSGDRGFEFVATLINKVVRWPDF